MGIIHEEIICNKIEPGNRLTIDDWAKGVEREPYRNISLEVDDMAKFTPKELIQFGEWLIKQAKRIQNEYAFDGRPTSKAE